MSNPSVPTSDRIVDHSATSQQVNTCIIVAMSIVMGVLFVTTRSGSGGFAYTAALACLFMPVGYLIVSFFRWLANYEYDQDRQTLTLTPPFELRDYPYYAVRENMEQLEDVIFKIDQARAILAYITMGTNLLGITLLASLT